MFERVVESECETYHVRMSFLSSGAFSPAGSTQVVYTAQSVFEGAQHPKAPWFVFIIHDDLDAQPVALSLLPSSL